MDLRRITRDHFLPLIGEELATSCGRVALPLRLVEAEELEPSQGGQGRPDPFVLLLVGAPDSPRLEQGLHAIEHPELGELQLFLVPVQTNGPEPSYEVIFN